MSDERKEDDIVIDFSAIVSRFSRKKAKGKKEGHEGSGKHAIQASEGAAPAADDGVPKGRQHRSRDAAGLALGFLGDPKARAWALIALLVILPLAASLYLRLQPAYLPVTDDWAARSVDDFYKANIRQQIRQQYPTLPADRLETLVQAEFMKFAAANRNQMRQEATGLSEQFKTHFQDEQGQTYLLAIDPYFWYRYARNYLDHGYDLDRIDEAGRYIDDHVLAPLGRVGLPTTFQNFHVRLIVYFYRFLSFWKPDVSLMTATFYVPALVAALSVIPVFFIARRFGGNLAGFFAALIVAIHPSFLVRTAAGFADTDAYNVFFPLMITWFFIEAFYVKRLWTRIGLVAVAGFLVGAFSKTWGGYFFILNFLVLTVLAMIGYQLVTHRDALRKGVGNLIRQSHLREDVVVGVLFIVFSAAFVSLFRTFPIFLRSVQEMVGFTRIKDVATTTVWPNVYTTVAELNPASMSSIIDSIGIGSRIIFFLGFVGLVLSFYRFGGKPVGKRAALALGVIAAYYVVMVWIQRSVRSDLLFLVLMGLPLVYVVIVGLVEKDLENNLQLTVLLSLWVLGSMYAGTKGVRFIMLFVPPFAVAFAITLSFLYRQGSAWLARAISLNRAIVKAVLVLLFLMLLLQPIHASLQTARNEVPSMSDGWHYALIKIRDNAAEDAIINSWWDFGHWFKAIADRAVTLDGGGQSQPQAHWLGKILLTSDEDEAVGILRMLDCGATKAYDAIYNETGDHLATKALLDSVLVLDRDGAAERLSETLSPAGVENTLLWTHCDPPEDYFITSADMVSKSGVWAHFGSWDFPRSVMYNLVSGMGYAEGVRILTGQFNLSSEKADQFYYEIQSTLADQWISPWPSYQSSVAGCTETDELISCTNGLLVDRPSFRAYVTTASGEQDIKSLSWKDDDGRYRYQEHAGTVPLGATLYRRDGKWNSVLMDPILTGSMMTRLFFLQGAGLLHFDQFDYQRTITGDDIWTWKVNWEGRAPAPAAQEQDLESEGDVPDLADLAAGMANLEEAGQDLETPDLGLGENTTV
ncbi:hypothetical protein JXB02_01840 [Candidatus Woesearchaeota archaeon]|nr:hypothetical protein [Candidatus Woesearchaeota archaeon]